MKDRREDPLRVVVKGGALTISIGVETLAWAFEQSQDCQPHDDETGKFMQRLLVTNPVGFAADVKREIQREEEDGNTELYKFLDLVCMNAVDDGSVYIEEPEGMEADQRTFEQRAKVWRKKQAANQTPTHKEQP